MLKRFFKESSIYGISKILSRGILIFLVPIYTRFFSTNDYGIVDLLAVFASLVNLTVALEITQGVARYYAGAGSQQERFQYASTSLWFTIGAYILFFCVASIAGGQITQLFFDSQKYKNIFLVASLAICGDGIFYLFQNQLRWQLEPLGYAVVSFIYILITAGISVFFVALMKSGIIGVFYGKIAGAFCGISIAFFYTKKNYGFYFNWNRCKTMLFFSLPLVPSGVAVFVSNYVDRMAIKHFMTIGDVGLYGVGFRFASAVSLLMAGFQGALMPLVYRNFQKESTPRELAEIFRYFIILALSGIMFLTVFPREILYVFTTPDYYDAWVVIPIISAAILLYNMYIFAPGLGIRKKTKVVAVINIVTALFNTALNFVLIPFWGIIGAAVATFISSIVLFSLYMFFSQKHYYVPHKSLSIFGAAAFAVTVSSFLLFYFENSINLSIIFLKIAAIIISIGLISWIILGAQKLAYLLKIFTRKLLFFKNRC